MGARSSRTWIRVHLAAAGRAAVIQMHDMKVTDPDVVLQAGTRLRGKNMMYMMSRRPGAMTSMAVTVRAVENITTMAETLAVGRPCEIVKITVTESEKELATE